MIKFCILFLSAFSLAFSAQGVFSQMQTLFSPIKYFPRDIKKPIPPDRTYEIGEFAEGGVVIWVTDDKKHGLVVSKDNLETTPGSNIYTFAWAILNNTTGAIYNEPLPTVYTNPIPNKNYSGYQNQEKIEAQNSWTTNYPAFVACKNYSIIIDGKTYNDWFLPTKTELEQIFEQKDMINQVSEKNQGSALFQQYSDPSQYYWSSFENGDSNAQIFDFSNGQSYGSVKNYPYAVRCVRAF
jgi:hypothetical protein